MEILKKVGFAASAIVATGAAHAAVPTEATDAITEIGTDASTLLTAVWPVVIAITAGFILVRLVKRFMRAVP